LTATDDPPEDAPEEAVSQLNESLKTCHKVVTDYRAALLRPASPAEPAVEEPQPNPEN
jgi:hypothetical protein